MIKYHTEQLESRASVVDNAIRQVGRSGFVSTKCDFATREILASRFADLVNFAFPYACPAPADAGILHTLQTDGFCVFPSAVDESMVDRIVEYYEHKPGYNRHVPVYSDRVARVWTPDYPYPMLSYTPDLGLQCPELRDLIVNPQLVSIAQAYLGCFPTFYSLNVYRTLPQRKYETHEIHRDYDDYRFLAFFIYLTDVDEGTGPFIYYPGTHRAAEMTREPVQITAKKGSIVVADTYGLHHGSVPTDRTRFACWWRYGIGLNAAYHADRNFDYKVPLADLFGPSSDAARYLLRGFDTAYPA